MSYTNVEISKMLIEDFNQICNNLKTDFDDFWTEEIFKSEFNSENSYYLVAKINNEIVGFAGIKTILDEADIMNVVTKKNKRNCGIGYLLLTKLLEIAKEKNIKTLTLEVNEHNCSAIHLYEKLGFKQIAVRPKYYNNVDNALIMQINK